MLKIIIYVPSKIRSLKLHAGIDEAEESLKKRCEFLEGVAGEIHDSHFPFSIERIPTDERDTRIVLEYTGDLDRDVLFELFDGAYNESYPISMTPAQD